MFQSFVSDIMKSLRLAQSCPEATLVAQPQEQNMTRERAYSTEEYTVKKESGAAQWDNKRQKCKNCKHIYLKYLSPAADYCSMDCKSNAMYLYAMSEKIRAVKENVMNQQELEAKTIVVPSPQKEVAVEPQETPSTEAGDDFDIHFESEYDSFDGSGVSYNPPATFAEFHTQKMSCRPVEWSFSALY